MAIPPMVLQAMLEARASDPSPVRQSPEHQIAFTPRATNPGQIRVGFLCPSLHQGGAEAWQALLARSLDDRFAVMGAAVIFGEGATDPVMVAAHARTMPVLFGAEAAADLARVCDVVVTWAVDGLPRILAGLGRTRPKVVSVVHSPPESEWASAFYARAEGVDQWVAVSELARQALPELARPSAAVIWNSVDTARMTARRSRAEVHASWGLPPGSLVAGFLGRLAPEKGSMAMARLAEYLPAPWQVVMVGDGPDRADLEEAKADHQLDRLHLVGQDTAAGEVLGGFDALVVPSEYESFGLSMGEGLWAGVPVISTPVGLALIRPGCTQLVGVNPSGGELADAVRMAKIRGPKPGSQSWARQHLAPERFARDWSELLASSVGRLDRRPTLESLVYACRDRGPVLPISQQPDCGCSGRELSECRAGKGKSVGRVTLADCYSCASSF